MAPTLRYLLEIARQVPRKDDCFRSSGAGTDRRPADWGGGSYRRPANLGARSDRKPGKWGAGSDSRLADRGAGSGRRLANLECRLTAGKSHASHLGYRLMAGRSDGSWL